MKRQLACVLSLALPAAVLALLPYQPSAAGGKPATKPAIQWKKTVVDRTFHSEGVAVADVNRDGKPDIITGDVWYEAPDWKKHILREDPSKDPKNPKYDPKGYSPLRYSHSFAVFADDFNGDGWPDVLVIPFPGDPCLWYENPGKKGGYWKGHVLSQSACNETPQYADLLGNGKRVLIMGVQPKGQDNMGQMFWLRPGKDPYQLWEHHPISVPSEKGKVVPGTFRFSHGLGVGDVNRDGRNDVITTAGWWEHPAKHDGQPWKFHPATLGPDCADMYALDLDGDGKNDILSSSAHNFGLWWHQQKPGTSGPTFVRHDISLGGLLFKDQKNYPLSADDKKLLDLVNVHRARKNLPALRAVPLLCRALRDPAKTDALLKAYPDNTDMLIFSDDGDVSCEKILKHWLDSGGDECLTGKWTELGVALVRDKKKTTATIIVGAGRTSPHSGVVIWENMKKQFFSQSHALNLVDVNGDGLKDLVTGRRWWAHGPAGDAAPTEPAYLFWLEARKSGDGIVTFFPHLIDDDSGIGTQFACEDINGDGIPDVIISNKKGVFVFEQVRVAARKEN